MENFITQLRKDLNTLVSQSSSSSSSSSQAIVPQPQPPPPQRTRAAAYVSPPRPILPQAIADAPQAAQKRTVEQIEGIEEEKKLQKARLKLNQQQLKLQADDPRALSLEEQAKAETVLNDFMRYEIKRIEESKNIDVTEEYLRDTIRKPGELQKELDNYIKRNQSLTPAVFVKVKPFINERVESIIKPQLHLSD
jgi:hypothetical protein